MFDELENVDNATHEDVVDSQGVEDTQEVEEVEVEETQVEGEESEASIDENEEVVEPQSEEGQSPEKNAQFAKMRRKAEEEARVKLEKERAELEQARKEIEEFKRQQEEARIEKETIESVTPEQISKTAYDMGVTEQYAKELLIERARNEATQKKIAYHENLSRIEKQKAELRNKPFFEDLEADIDNMIKQNPNLEPQTAYTFLRGEKFEELMSRQSNIKEKSMVANMHDKARRKPIGNDGSTDTTPELSDFGKQFATFMGVDPKEAAGILKTRRRK